MKKQAQTQTQVQTEMPTREQFVREYMAQLSANRPPKAGIITKVAGVAEDLLVDAVANSRKTAGRVAAAWEISGQIYDEAYAREHARYAEKVATRLGLQ